MNITKFSFDHDGFYGTYYENKTKATAAIIGLFGDDPNDYLAKTCAKYLQKFGLNVMTMSPGKKDYSHVNVPIETIETAMHKLKEFGNQKIGIIGMSTTGMFALTAASYLPDLTLTIGLTPSDFVWQGFQKGNREGCEEWPVPNASTLSWRGEPLPYMPFVYQHPDYWHTVQEETKGTGNHICSRRLFDDSEKNREHPEDEMIKV